MFSNNEDHFSFTTNYVYDPSMVKIQMTLQKHKNKTRNLFLPSLVNCTHSIYTFIYTLITIIISIF